MLWDESYVVIEGFDVFVLCEGDGGLVGFVFLFDYEFRDD